MITPTVETVLAHLRATGCDCEPDITTTGENHFQVAHDADCALLLDLQVDGRDRMTPYSNPPG